MEKSKLIGTSLKRKVGNYRIEYFKVDRDSPIAFVEIGMYVESPYNNNGAVLRALHGIWNRNTLGFDLDGLNLDIQLPDSLENTFGYITCCVRFELEGIGRKLDELAYEVLEDKIIDMIEDSKLVVIDK